MRGWTGIAAALGLAIAMPASATAPTQLPAGLWLNPHNNVAVRTGPCGTHLCGWVVWASASARADAKGGGVERLLGTELLEDYAADGSGAWSGTVFVPDMGRRFASRIDLPRPDALRIRGCLWGGMICRTQTWSRIEQVPHG